MTQSKLANKYFKGAQDALTKIAASRLSKHIANLIKPGATPRQLSRQVWKGRVNQYPRDLFKTDIMGKVLPLELPYKAATGLVPKVKSSTKTPWGTFDIMSHHLPKEFTYPGMVARLKYGVHVPEEIAARGDRPMYRSLVDYLKKHKNFQRSGTAHVVSKKVARKKYLMSELERIKRGELYW